MHLITERTIREFYETPGNEDSKDSLVNWAARVKKAKWQSLAGGAHSAIASKGLCAMDRSA